ncbi:MAG: 16S rRNA (uracil(1498)-N(3))-methyltransferase [Bacteroidia bacterium]|nr:16S rRNA (uracil(1498)-N(3))-methyltransferase [Bacteroidia bacterium]
MSAVYVASLRERNLIYLTGEEFHHAIHTLRHKVGDLIWLTDGQGYVAKGCIESISPSQATISVLDLLERPGEPSVSIGLVVSPLKQLSRIEWLVEKSVELGATHLYFLPMQRSVRSSINILRLQRVALAALKQNLRSVLPHLHLLKGWEEIPWESYSVKLMGEIGSSTPLHAALPTHPTSLLWVVGPEGDFTPQELKLLREVGCRGVSLGTLRLRAETAAIFLLASLKMLWKY